MSAIERFRECLLDLDPEFVRAAAIGISWEYDTLFEELDQDDTLTVDLKLEQFARRRAYATVKALTRVAKQHGVPFDFLHVANNGQKKLVLKIGRIALIQEPMTSLAEAPRAADYKRELAASNSLICQLELDLGDREVRVQDWSGSVLAVVLHGPAGPAFTRDDRALGGLMLAVPDAAYNHWLIRLDLHQIAMYGAHAEDAIIEIPAAVTQPDKVRVTLKVNKDLKKA